MSDDAGKTEGRAILRVARKTLEEYLRTGRNPGAEALGVGGEAALLRPGAAFVTLRREGELRGCIGQILPTGPLWESVRENAVAAAVRDPRFPPVREEELSGLDLEVSVLTEPRPVASPEAFEPGRHGVILELHGRRALFLPQVAPEQGWDRAQTLAALCRKAGLPAGAWRDPAAKLFVFEARVYEED